MNAINDHQYRQPKPHSHVFADGRFMPVVTPTAKEQATVFAQEVAKAGLIQINDRHDELDAPEDSVQQKQRQKQPLIHPIAQATGHIRGQCLGELSKAVNLAGLVLGGEYIELHHVLQNDYAEDGITDNGGKRDSRSTTQTINDTFANSFVEPSTDPQILQLDSALRANFILQRKQKNYLSCQRTLHRHATACYAATALYHYHLDRHMLLLRRNGWKMTLPLRKKMLESMSSRKRMISSRDIAALQLNIYRVDPPTSPRSISSLFSRVPHFATVEIIDKAISSLSSCQKHPSTSYHRRSSKKRRTDMDSSVKKEEVHVHPNHETPSLPTEPMHSTTSPSYLSSIVQIQPLTYGSTDTSISSTRHDNICRSLVFQLEDTTNGNIISQHELSHSSEILDHAGHDSEDSILDTLQQSLFCAQLFESLKSEVLQFTSSSGLATKGSNIGTATSTQSHSTTATSIWLPRGMSDAGIPPPSLMIGSGKVGGSVPVVIENVDILPRFTVIYCHEGEFKILFNSRYTLIVTLQEYSLDRCIKVTEIANNIDVNPEYRRLSLILRLLLLHSQSMYHVYRKELDEVMPPSVSDKSIQESPSPPRILQSCLALGSKCIMEFEIRKNLEVKTRFLCFSSLALIKLSHKLSHARTFAYGYRSIHPIIHSKSFG